MDPLADKLLVCIALICFVKLRGEDAVGDYSFPAWCAIIIMTREFAISGIRQLAADKGIIIAAGMWGKVKTVVQLFMCLDYIIMPEFIAADMKWFAVAGVICGAVVANLLHWGIASINGMVVASIIYIIGRKASGKKA